MPTARARAPRSPKGRAVAAAELLAGEYDALCELDHRNPFELLAATILSAQCTDARVNAVTPTLFERYPTPAALAAADTATLEEIVHSTGFFASKARSLIGMSSALVERHGGAVPTDLEALVDLPGVGRKTANLVRVVAFGLPGLPVDTHVIRIANRLGLTDASDATEIEHELAGFLRVADRGPFALRTILHGRRVCVAKKPACGDCVLAPICPSSQLR